MAKENLILKYWQIIVVIFAAGGLYYTVNALESRVCAREVCANEQEKRLIIVETVVKENLPDIKEALKDWQRSRGRRRDN